LNKIEVTADSLHEALAQGLLVFRENEWIDEAISQETSEEEGFLRLPPHARKLRFKKSEERFSLLGAR
jgi:hypothetical protein